MSRTTRRKHVMKELDEDDFDLPKENQKIMKVVSSRGNNLLEVESAESDDKFLVSMPTKFRKNLWVKRGDFVLVESIDEGDKVKGEIVRVLSADHIRIFTQDGVWPKKFTKKRDRDEDDDDDDGDLIRNTNRTQNQKNESSEEEDDSEDED